MTPTEWLALSPRERDAIVAEKVMGLEVLPDFVPAWAPEGDWSVTPDSPHHTPHPVYVRECVQHDEFREREVGFIGEAAKKYGWTEAQLRKAISKHDAEWVGGHHRLCLDVVPFFTTSWNAMREVIAKMEADDFWFNLVRRTDTIFGKERPDPLWFARFRCVRGGTRGDKEAWAGSAPEAVAVAALTALGHMEAE